MILIIDFKKNSIVQKTAKMAFNVKKDISETFKSY